MTDKITYYNKIAATAAMTALFMFATPAFAQSGASSDMQGQTTQMMEEPASGNNPDTPDMPEVTKEDIKEGWEQTKEATEETIEKIRAAFINEQAEPVSIAYVEINPKATAKGMLSQDVLGLEGEKVGTIEDIIINERGRAETVVISHGGLMGIGAQKTAMDYNDLFRFTANNRVMMMPVSQQVLENGMRYSYNPEDAGVDADANLMVMPESSMRVSRLLGSNVSNNRGEIVANADNIHFDEDMAERLIISFNGDYGLGKDYASLEYDRMDLMKINRNNYQYRMSARQTNAFESFKRRKEGY